MTEQQLEKIKTVSHALDSGLDYCNIVHLGRWDDVTARDILCIVSPAGTPAYETKPIGRFRVTPAGAISFYDGWE
jgi:hypothetical protein